MPNTKNVAVELISRYGDDLYRWALSKTNDRSAAEDLVQDTFLSAIKSMKDFRQQSKLRTWLFSILNNKIIDHHRRKFRDILVVQSTLGAHIDRDDVIERTFDEHGTWKKNAVPEEWNDDPENLLDDSDFRNVLDACLKALPARWFSAVHLRYLSDKDGPAICQELDISPSNYWQILHRAKLRLRSCLTDNWFGK